VADDLSAPVLPADLVGRAAALAHSERPDRDATERTRAFLALADRQNQEDAGLADSLLCEAMVSALRIPSYRHLDTDLNAKSDLWRKLRSRLYLLPVSRQHSLAVWAMAELSRRDRDGCPDGLGELLPLILKLGGQAALAEAETAASDVARWWP
jgi:hypothetical protein